MKITTNSAAAVMPVKPAWVLALLMLIAACDPTSSRPAVSTTPPENVMETEPLKTTTERNSVNPEVHALNGILKKGMAYADFRNQLLAHGWMPVIDAGCKANVVGTNHVALCADNPDLATCQVCDQMPELNACSGDGHCLVRFQNTDNTEIMEATSYGMIEDWNVSGEDSRLQVSQWDISTAK